MRGRGNGTREREIWREGRLVEGRERRGVEVRGRGNGMRERGRWREGEVCVKRG